MDGQWQFYWKELLQPGDKPDVKPIDVGVPHSWSEEMDDDGNNLPMYGYGTYTTKVILSNDHPDRLAFKLRRIKMAHKLFVNGELLSTKGNVGIDKEQEVAEHVPYIVEFAVPKDTATLEIYLQVSNHTYPILSGLNESILIGTPNNLQRLRENKLFWSTFVSGALFIIAVYHFFFWLKRRVDKPALFFFIFCLGISLRMLVTEEKFALVLFPFLSSTTILSLELMSVFWSIPFLHIFVHSLFPNSFQVGFGKVPLQRISYAVFALLIGGTILTPIQIHGYFVIPFEIYTLLMLLHIVIVACVAVARGEPNASIFIFGFIALFCTGINDILHERSIINTSYIFHIGVLIFVLSQATLLSIRYANAFNKIEDFNQTLEETVKERTEEVRRLSQSITNTLEAERKQIASEIHDSVNPQIIHVKLQIQSFIKKNSDKLEVYLSDLNALVMKLENLYQSARSVVRQLRPVAFDALGLKAALENLLDEYNANMPECSIDYMIDSAVDKINEDTKLTIFRIFQEAMTNIIKYASATEVSVNIKSTMDSISVLIKDNGVGFEVVKYEGLGLISMRERAMYVGGTFNIKSSIGKGTTVSASLPIKPS